jgi:hypothetical protein
MSEGIKMSLKKYVVVSFFALAMVYSSEAKSPPTTNPGNTMVAKADSVLYPRRGTYDLLVNIEYPEGKNIRKQEFHMEVFKSGKQQQTIIWSAPSIQKDDVGVRRNSTIYYKRSKWHKPEIMSYQSVFVESPFSWGDIMSSDLESDFSPDSTHEFSDSTGSYLFLRLRPLRKDLYQRIDVVIDKKSFITKSRTYYTASNEVLKTATYDNFSFNDQKEVAGFTVTMWHSFHKLKAKAVLSNMVTKNVPETMFNPQNIDRIKGTK